MSEITDFQESCGNIFADLGLPDAGELLAKAQLVSRIGDLIDEQGLSQADASRIMGVDQLDLQALLRGQLEKFSMERLFGFLNALDCDVQIIIQRRPQSRHAHTLVVPV
ncbi:MAG: helix-turn-helix domain-containing protein [Magnetococcus sp. DMHC-1]